MTIHVTYLKKSHESHKKQIFIFLFSMRSEWFGIGLKEDMRQVVLKQHEAVLKLP